MTVPYSAVLHDASMPPRREDRERMGYTPEQMARLEARDAEFAREEAARGDEFWHGVWWVPADAQCSVRRLSREHKWGWRTPTPGECYAEIIRLRDQNAALRAEVVRLTAALDDAVRPEDWNAI